MFNGLLSTATAFAFAAVAVVVAVIAVAVVAVVVAQLKKKIASRHFPDSVFHRFAFSKI